MPNGPNHPDDIYSKQQRPRMGRRRRGNSSQNPRRKPGLATAGRRHTGRFADGNPHRPGLGVWVVLGLLGILLVYIGFLAVVSWSARQASPPPVLPTPRPTAVAVARAVEVVEVPGPQVVESLETEMEDFIEAWNRSRSTLQRLRISTRPEDQASALDSLRERLEKTPDWLPLHQEFARRAYRAGAFAEALPALRRAIAMDPGSLEMRTLLAHVLLRQRDYAAAERVARWNLELDPYSTELQQIIADALLARGRLENALPHLRVIAESSPLDLKLQNQYADALSRAGQYERAVSIYTRLVQQDPTHAVTYYNFAICHTRQNRPEAAIQVLRQAAERLGPDFVKNWLGNTELAPLQDSEAWRAWLLELETPAR